MSEDQRAKRWRSPALASISVVATFVVFLGGDFILNHRDATRQHEEIAKEFSIVRPPSSASLQSTSDNFSSTIWSARNHQGTVAGYYKTKDDESSIRKHYDQELLSKSWRFVFDRPLTHWGTDSGEREVLYCKQHLYASLYLRGGELMKQYPDGFNYEFSISWGNRPAELNGKCD